MYHLALSSIVLLYVLIFSDTRQKKTVSNLLRQSKVYWLTIINEIPTRHHWKALSDASIGFSSVCLLYLLFTTIITYLADLRNNRPWVVAEQHTTSSIQYSILNRLDRLTANMLYRHIGTRPSDQYFYPVRSILATGQFLWSGMLFAVNNSSFEIPNYRLW